MIHMIEDHLFPNHFGPETEEQHQLDFRAHNVIPSAMYNQCCNNQIWNCNLTSEMTGRELNQTVLSTSSNNVPGLDGIQGIIYHLHYNIWEEYFLQLFNACLWLQHFSSNWKIAPVVFILKNQIKKTSNCQVVIGPSVSSQ